MSFNINMWPFSKTVGPLLFVSRTRPPLQSFLYNQQFPVYRFFGRGLPHGSPDYANGQMRHLCRQCSRRFLHPPKDDAFCYFGFLVAQARVDCLCGGRSSSYSKLTHKLVLQCLAPRRAETILKRKNGRNITESRAIDWSSNVFKILLKCLSKLQSSPRFCPRSLGCSCRRGNSIKF